MAYRSVRAQPVYALGPLTGGLRRRLLASGPGVLWSLSPPAGGPAGRPLGWLDGASARRVFIVGVRVRLLRQGQAGWAAAVMAALGPGLSLAAGNPAGAALRRGPAAPRRIPLCGGPWGLSLGAVL